MNQVPSLDRARLLSLPVEHPDLASHDVSGIVGAMGRMSVTARDLSRAADIWDVMVREPGCGIILCLAGSLVSGGLRAILRDLVRYGLVDAIVSTGANLVDQDFFEALGFRHYVAPDALRGGGFDEQLRELRIDRIYDTLIDEDQLRICDDTVRQIADGLEARPWSSREFLAEMGRWLNHQGRGEGSILLECYRQGVPVFCPAFSDCSAGFGLVAHQVERSREGKPCLTLDSVRDFLELTRVKLAAGETGLVMMGGGVPKNFAQDTVVAADILGHEVPMHKYAIQVTVADVRDGGLSGSTLREACSWGKVDTAFEQMVYAEATLALPLLASAVYHRRGWEGREPRRFAKLFCAKS